MISGAMVSSTVQLSQAGFPAMMTNALFKQIASLMYVKSSIGGYFFDVVFRTDHSYHLNITSHPVQGGANISDHCYMEPARLTMEIGASDVGTSLIFGQFFSAKSKAKSAFDALLKMQSNRLPLTVVTKFASYKNMLIEDLSIPDDIKTYSGLRATVSMRQIILVDVAKETKLSARPAVTGSTPGGNAVTVEPKQTTARKIELATGVQ